MLLTSLRNQTNGWRLTQIKTVSTLDMKRHLLSKFGSTCLRLSVKRSFLTSSGSGTTRRKLWSQSAQQKLEKSTSCQRYGSKTSMTRTFWKLSVKTDWTYLPRWKTIQSSSSKASGFQESVSSEGSNSSASSLRNCCQSTRKSLRTKSQSKVATCHVVKLRLTWNESSPRSLSKET